MNEFELIAELTRGLASNPNVVVGPGDDCAVLDLGDPVHWVLFKTDAVIEGVHFAPGTPGEKVGHKALGRCLSDVAAMGGSPLAAVVTLAVPQGPNLPYLQAIYEGMNALSRRHGVAIVGGETTATSGPMLLSVALVGRVPRSKCVLRSGAKPGDAIFVTGELGGSAAGKHLEFEPRLEESHWLIENFELHAMIDLSDGLAGDLRHVLEASQVGAELLAEAVPVSRAARVQSAAFQDAGVPCGDLAASVPGAPGSPPGPRKTALLAALTDGEDFEMLFTTASANAVPMMDGWKRQFPSLRLSCIGRITAEPGLCVRTRTGLQELNAHGYTHFA